MASSTFSLFILFPLLLLSLSTSSLSHICDTQTLQKNQTFDHCEDLPQLNAFLHWSFNSSDSSLDVAFLAAPATPAGWVSWAINPSGKGMIGSQALIAFRQPNDGKMVVQTFNITGYKNVHQSPISLKVTDVAADFSGSLITIYAKFRIPAGWTSINHVWQLGGAVEGSSPKVHAFDPSNLSSMGKLELPPAKAAPAPSPDGGDSATPTSGSIAITNSFGRSISLLIPLLLVDIFVKSCMH